MTTNPPSERLARLVGYLDADPDNLALLRDAVGAALSAGEPDVAQALLSHIAALTPLTLHDESMLGLIAMQRQDFISAATTFGRLIELEPANPSLRFNLAWSLAMQRQFEAALPLLDEQTVAALPQAAALKLELMHDQGLFEEAGQLARALIERHPSHPGLLAAASVLAIDNEDFAAAATYATRAGDHPDALTTRGLLALNEERTMEAATLFADALAQNDASPRALIGAGLTRLVSGEPTEAADQITRGAEIFATHAGSWIGAGWARLIANDLVRARAAFERALDIDDTFAESHGSLAVIDIMQGDVAAARRRAETARRLDPQSFSAALALALLASAEQRPDLAKAIVDKALNTPIDGGGRTIAQSLARLGLGS